MTIVEMKEVLKNGNFDIRGREIKTVCKNCGKHYMVDLGTMAEAMVKEGNASCSSCGTQSLIPALK